MHLFLYFLLCPHHPNKSLHVEHADLMKLLEEYPVKTHQLATPEDHHEAKRMHPFPLRGGQGTHGSLEPPCNHHVTFEGVATAYDERTAAAFLAIDILTRAKTFERLVGGVDEALKIAPHLPWEAAAKLHPDKHHQQCVLDAIELSRERVLDEHFS